MLDRKYSRIFQDLESIGRRVFELSKGIFGATELGFSRWNNPSVSPMTNQYPTERMNGEFLDRSSDYIFPD